MKRTLGLIILTLLVVPAATAQEGNSKSLAATMDVMVFPAEGHFFLGVAVEAASVPRLAWHICDKATVNNS